MTSRIKFLISLGNLIKNGAVKTVKQAMDFAEQQFGKIDKSFTDDIINVFKKEGKTKKGDVVPIKKQESLVRKPEEFDTRKEYERYLDDILGPDDDVFGVSPIKTDLLKKWDKVNAKDVTPKKGIMATDEAADMVKGEMNPKTHQMSNQQREFLGFPNRSVEAIVRTAARDVLEKAGLGPRIKGQDPIDMARQIYGDEILDALDNISGELLDASSYSEIARILTEKKIYNFKPRSGLDIKQKGEIEDITAFDIEGRDPNADGGLIDILKL